MGLLVALLCALWPLLQVLRQSPNAIFHRDVAPVPTDRRAALRVAAVLGLGLGAVAWWQAGAWPIAALFLGALLAAGALLTGAAWAMARLTRAAPRPKGMAWRRGLAHLHRPGSRTTTVIVSIGVGVMVVLAVALVERSVRAELVEQIPQGAPSVFFIDIQPDQKDGFAALLAARSIPPELTPVVRSRLLAIDDHPLGPEGRPETKPEDRWYFTREYVLTFREALPRDNVIVAGQWWDGVPPTPEVSVEEDAARHLGVTVGSTISFDVQGVAVMARVTSLRSVQWDNRSTNFYVIFAPGALEQAPLTYLAAARVPPADETRLLQDAVAAFPNVTAIQVGDILASVARVLTRIALAVRAVGAFTVLAGLVVLAGALAATRHARLREAMIFKALGATRRVVARAFAVEFAVLGGTAGLIGTVLAAALAWAVLRFIVDIPWRWDPVPLVVSVVLTVAGTVAVGVGSTHRLLGKRPFAALRDE
jgi:putative ABC transport system permease protein